ncbi:hypothetical protein EX30DRAFT_337770 [Ascodesmis nigricans]|uniref:GPI anchored protein n=1 Tax=Ascodesmis nigricans TaxID=341454 RepID=A0A4S2N7X2_9PEZI|nr:hypothetical protein EX30DRAFT_337770 [Ascodesmis nigricans]
MQLKTITFGAFVTLASFAATTLAQDGQVYYVTITTTECDSVTVPPGSQPSGQVPGIVVPPPGSSSKPAAPPGVTNSAVVPAPGVSNPSVTVSRATNVTVVTPTSKPTTSAKGDAGTLKLNGLLLGVAVAAVMAFL